MNTEQYWTEPYILYFYSKSNSVVVFWHWNINGPPGRGRTLRARNLFQGCSHVLESTILKKLQERCCMSDQGQKYFVCMQLNPWLSIFSVRKPMCCGLKWNFKKKVCTVLRLMFFDPAPAWGEDQYSSDMHILLSALHPLRPEISIRRVAFYH